MSYLAGERQCGGHLLHRQVPDARGERAPAGRAAAQLLAARVADQVTRLTLQDGRQDVVEAHRALEQRRELRGLCGQADPGQGRRRGRGGRPRPDHRAHTGGCRCCRGRCRRCCCGASCSPVLSACFPGPESSDTSTSDSGSG